MSPETVGHLSWHSTVVTVQLVITWRPISVFKDMPPKTIPDQRLTWMKSIMTTVHSSQCFQAFTPVTLLSSVKTTDDLCLTCWFWCSLMHANCATWCWAVSTGPTREHWALSESESWRSVMCRGHFVRRWQCSSGFLLKGEEMNRQEC